MDNRELIKSKLKQYTYIVTVSDKLQCIYGVALDYEEARTFYEKMIKEKNYKYHLEAIIEGEYTYNKELEFITPTKMITGYHKKTRNSMYDYFIRLCKTLNIHNDILSNE